MMGGTGQLALNQLLVVDGRHRQPAVHAPRPDEPHQHVPRRDLHRPAAARQGPLRLPPPRPARRPDLLHRRDERPDRRLDPALTGPGRMGRHVWFRTPTKEDRQGHLRPLPRARSRTSPTSTRPKRRDEIARITNGYSPAMIDQVCSMALTNAHHDGRAAFAWERPRRGDDDDRVGHRDRHRVHRRARRRAVAIHEAGHAAAGARLSCRTSSRRRLSIKMRGGSLGHHQALEKEERFSRLPQRGDGAARLRRSARWRPSASSTARTRTASAATSSRRRRRPRWMVGASAMGPEPFDRDAARRRDRGGGARARHEALRGDRRSRS